MFTIQHACIWVAPFIAEAPATLLTLGYHDKMMRATKATSKYRRTGSSTSFVGPTHAGASAAARSGNPPSAASATTAAPAARPLAVDAAGKDRGQRR